jgi:hypothetical protein
MGSKRLETSDEKLEMRVEMWSSIFARSSLKQPWATTIYRKRKIVFRYEKTCYKNTGLGTATVD